MARKTSKKTTPRAQESSNLSLAAIKSLTLAVLLSLATYACKLALHPLYASTPTALHFSKVTLASFLVSAALPAVIPEHIALLSIGLILSAGPTTALWLGTLTGRQEDVVWGPIITQGALAIPTVIFAGSLLQHWRVSYLIRSNAESRR